MSQQPIRSGNEHSIAEELYDRYQRLWYRIASQIVKTPEDTQDVVQEAYRKFLSLDREWPSLEDARRYFTAMVTNTAIDFYKATRRKQERFAAGDPDVHAPLIHLAECRKPWDSSQREREEQLMQESRESLQLLPPLQRQAIELLLLGEDDRSLTDVSRDLGIPISTLKSRALSGLEKVRKKLRRKGLL